MSNSIQGHSEETFKGGGAGDRVKANEILSQKHKYEQKKINVVRSVSN